MKHIHDQYGLKPETISKVVPQTPGGRPGAGLDTLGDLVASLPPADGSSGFSSLYTPLSKSASVRLMIVY